ncbi:MAG: PQQ-binding-like beta-propeller repeat protein [Deinococcus sp.]|nr:PQQ-binding-like beta-propeller repeat protein [Deinococcus sp.]
MIRLAVLTALASIVALVQPAQLPAVAQEAGLSYIYLPNAADGTISIIDPTSNQVLSTIPIGEKAAHGIAAGPDGRTVYAGDAGTNELVVLDVASGTITTRIPLTHGVHGIDISPDGRYVWVGGRVADFDWLGAVSVINTGTNQVEAVISPGLGSASHFAFTPDGRQVWIASTTTNLVWVIDTTSRQIAAVIPLGQGTPAGEAATPEGEKGLIGFNEVAFAPDGGLAYAISPESGQVYAIETATYQVGGSAQAGERAHGITVTRDGREVWTANRSGTVTVLDAASLALLATIPMGEYANHIAFSLDNRLAYVTRSGDVAVVDTTTREVVATIPVGNEPHELSLEDQIGFTPVGSRVRFPPMTELTRRDRGQGGVTVEAIWITPDYLATVEVSGVELLELDRNLIFLVRLDTHAGDLLQYNLAQLAILRDERGGVYQALAWEGLSEDSHHRSGLLRFPMVEPGAALELVVRNIARADERVFSWDLSDQASRPF